MRTIQEVAADWDLEILGSGIEPIYKVQATVDFKMTLKADATIVIERRGERFSDPVREVEQYFRILDEQHFKVAQDITVLTKGAYIPVALPPPIEPTQAQLDAQAFQVASQSYQLSAQKLAQLAAANDKLDAADVTKLQADVDAKKVVLADVAKRVAKNEAAAVDAAVVVNP